MHDALQAVRLHRSDIIRRKLLPGGHASAERRWQRIALHVLASLLLAAQDHRRCALNDRESDNGSNDNMQYRVKPLLVISLLQTRALSA